MDSQLITKPKKKSYDQFLDEEDEGETDVDEVLELEDVPISLPDANSTDSVRDCIANCPCAMCNVMRKFS